MAKVDLLVNCMVSKVQLANLLTGVGGARAKVPCKIEEQKVLLSDVYGAPLVTKFNKILASPTGSNCACAKHSIFQIL